MFTSLNFAGEMQKKAQLDWLLLIISSDHNLRSHEARLRLWIKQLFHTRWNVHASSFKTANLYKRNPNTPVKYYPFKAQHEQPRYDKYTCQMENYVCS